MQTLVAEHWIGGAWRPAEGGRAADSLNPADGSLVGRFADGGRVEADAAVAAARAAFEAGTWAASPRLRAAVLLAFADRLETRQEELALLMTRETGRLLKAARAELAGAVSELRYYGGLARAVFGRTLEVEPGVFSLLMREPAGVAGIIVPWNAPAILLVRSLAPAMAAGCTAVVKPAPEAALTIAGVLRCLSEVEALPAGVVNLVSEAGHEAAERLVASEQVDLISFTGSTATGKRIMAAAAGTLKRLSLELGGKAPCVVFQDVDMAAAAPRLAAAATIISGQQCTAAARVLVHESRAEELKQALAGVFRALKVGPGEAPESDLGPLIGIAQRDRIAETVARAADEGVVVQRGAVPEGPGAFVAPSLTAVQDLASPLVQEELFGPVLNLETFADESEAVARANGGLFGLAASVWTHDGARALRVSRAIRAGTVWVNDHNKLFAEAETGGFKQSGFGRLHGAEGMLEFLETKHVYQDAGVVPPAA